MNALHNADRGGKFGVFLGQLPAVGCRWPSRDADQYSTAIAESSW